MSSITASSHYLKIVITDKHAKRIDEDSELYEQVIQRVRIALYKYGWTSQALTPPERLFYSEFVCHDLTHPPTCSRMDEDSIEMGRCITERVCQRVQEEFNSEGLSVLIWCKQYTHDWEGDGKCIIRTFRTLTRKEGEGGKKCGINECL